MKIAVTLFHLSFLIFFVSLPFWPPQYMYIVRWIPLALICIWFVFEGCPVTFMDKSLDDRIFTQILVKPFFPSITKERVIILTYIVLFIVSILCTQKYYGYIYN